MNSPRATVFRNGLALTWFGTVGAGHAVQVSGKRRGEETVPKDADKDAVLAAAKAEPNVARHVERKQIVREIVVPGRLVNIVVKG